MKIAVRLMVMLAVGSGYASDDTSQLEVSNTLHTELYDRLHESACRLKDACREEFEEVLKRVQQQVRAGTVVLKDGRKIPNSQALQEREVRHYAAKLFGGFLKLQGQQCSLDRHLSHANIRELGQDLQEELERDVAVLKLRKLEREKKAQMLEAMAVGIMIGGAALYVARIW